MLINFFYTLRAAKLKVSVKEYLTLLEAIQSGVIDDGDGPTIDKFYYLARTSLVKDEAQFDGHHQHPLARGNSGGMAADIRCRRGPRARRPRPGDHVWQAA